MLTQDFDDALLMARRIHDGQTRKGTTIPYFAHVMGVASIALEHGASEEQAIAALLHDAVEDGEGAASREAIRQRFGPNVERLVMACSDSEGGDKAPWVERKCAYLKHLPEADADVLLVSASDKLHNLRSILTDLNDPAVGAGVFERFKAGQVGTVWYYGSLIAVYRASGKVPGRLLNELEMALEVLQAKAGGAVPPYPAVPTLPESAKQRSLA